MLRVKSFPITDAHGVNDLVTNYPLAKGMHILVSDGHVMIPYEDGAPEPAAVTIVRIGEFKNILIKERAEVQHSQAVLETLMDDAKKRYEDAKAESDKTQASADRKQFTNDIKKELLRRVNVYGNACDQLASQHRMNEHEIIRLNINLEKHDEEIKKLSA